MSYAAKIAIVTGAARRIGRALALSLAADGWRVAIHYRSAAEDAAGLTKEIERGGGTATTIRADLADAGEVAAVVPRCCELLGPPTCLINNASEFQFDTLATATLQSWQTHIDVNLRAPVFLAQSFANHLAKDGSGSIINVIDQRVLLTTPDFFTYSISKSALWTATRMLAQELAPRIRVNAIGPGPALQSIHQTQQDFAAESGSTLLGRGTAPEEIAAAARFILASPAMTGQLIVLDGGQHLLWPGRHASAPRS